MIGVINLDKPVGPTSHDMVGLVRRLTGMSRIGHAGTLDPARLGVLPILVGGATRLSEELTGGESATRPLSGWDTDRRPMTARDQSGRLAATRCRAVREALAAFVGTFDQMPPMYSAASRAGWLPTGRRGRAPPVTLEPVR
jgi:tRNA pseudouridine55 synthase